jgi:hypothetical protein
MIQPKDLIQLPSDEQNLLKEIHHEKYEAASL